MIDLVATLSAHAIATCEALQVDVHHLAVSPLAVRTAVESRWTGDPCGPRPRLRVHLRDGAGVTTTFAVQPELTVWVSGFTAPEAVAVDGSLTGLPGRVALDPRHGVPVATAGPWVARVPLNKGATLTTQVVAEPPAARKGTEVSVVVRRGGVVLSVSGRILSDGQLGEIVRVRHEQTDRVLVGRLVTPGTVEIP